MRELLKFTYMFVFVAAASCRTPEEGAGTKSQSPAILRNFIDFDWYKKEKEKQIAKNSAEREVNPEVYLGSYEEGAEKEDVIIYIEKDETIELISRWSGLSIKEILALNGHLKSSGFTEGEHVMLRMTPEQTKQFITRRNVFKVKKMERLNESLEFKEIIVHEIREGESISTILEIYPATKLEYIEKFNPGRHISNLKEGDKIKVPILK